MIHILVAHYISNNKCLFIHLDPFGFSKNKSAEAKERGLVSELNNGRLAQIGILGFLAEQKVEGSVPLLHGLVSHYNGEPMAPVRLDVLIVFCCLIQNLHVN
jgi:Chlorophyll A-B binding protein